MRPLIVKHQTFQPMRFALGVMGKTATAAADTWTMQELAGRYASRAPARNYVGQLRELYGGIIDRWRYVMEPGERVPGTPRALLGYVLGAAYNGCGDDPTRCDVSAIDWKHKGWGDCDDVATLAAAGILALGMRAGWRVATWPGGAHVNAWARTPRGEVVNIDPVGHPDHGFAWAMDPPNGAVRWFSLDGRPIAPPTGAPGAAARPELGPTRHLSGATAMPCSTYMGSPFERRAVTARKAHVVLTRPGDTRGQRVLALPPYAAQLFSRGRVMDRCPAVDQFGDVFEYIRGVDAWAPMGLYGPMGSRKSRRKKRRARRKRRRKKIVRAIKKVVRKAAKIVSKPIRRIAKKILGSKVARRGAAIALQAFGIPRAVTMKLLAAAEKVGGGTFLKLVGSGRWKKAAAYARKAITASGGSMAGWSYPGERVRLGQVETNLQESDADTEAGREWVAVHDGATYTVAPVAVMMGDPEVTDEARTIAEAPTPGQFYRIQKGDSLLSVAGKAWGLSSGGERLKRAKEINNAVYNAGFQIATENAFNKKYIGDQIVSFAPNYACEPNVQQQARGGTSGSCYAVLWIPPGPGVEPPEYVAPPVEPDEPEPPIPAPPEPVPTPTPEPPEEEDVLPPPPQPVPTPPDVEPVRPPEPSPPQPPEPPVIDEVEPPTKPIAPPPGPIAPRPTCPPGTTQTWSSGTPGFGPWSCQPLEPIAPPIITEPATPGYPPPTPDPGQPPPPRPALPVPTRPPAQAGTGIPFPLFIAAASALSMM